MQYFIGTFNKPCIKIDNYEYRHIIKSYSNGMFITDEASDWCNKNLEDWYYSSAGGETIFEFKSIEDAMAFKLMWE